MQEMSKDKKIVVGLTGNIASGKSSVAKYLESLGYQVIYADDLTHDLYIHDESFKEQIIDLLGPSILTDNQIDKSKVGAIVFNDKDKMKALEKMIHPLVLKKSLEMIESMNGLIVFEVPLLYEASYDKYCDKVIFVAIDRQIQLERLMSRNHLSKEEATARIASQVAQEEKMHKADYVIHNNMDLEHLYNQVDLVVKKIVGEYDG